MFVASCSIGRNVSKYLNATKSVGLEYLPFERPSVGTHRLWEQVIAFADACFGPPHDKHRSVQSVVLEHAGNTLMWETTKQPFIAQPTAKAEVLGYNQAYQATEATSSLLQIFTKKPIEKLLLGDNKAALTLCCFATGPVDNPPHQAPCGETHEALADGSDWRAFFI